MKKLSIFLFAAFLIFLLPKEIKANNPGYMQGYFYSNLTPYGTWISLDFGVYAWRPTIISRTWSPYRMGRWIWTDYGWYWDSYEPFGYIVYHYGRWHYDDYYGWIWIPDYEWAPAWVEWRYDDDYIGWAPLPPYAVFRVSVGIVYTYSYFIPVAHWHFVSFKHFCNPYVYNYYIPERSKYRVYSNTKYRNEYSYSGGRIRNEGVEFDFVRKRSGDNIRKRDLVITDDPRSFENSRKRDRDQITVFVADRERIIQDRESIRNADIVRNDRKTSLDLSRVELGDIRSRDEQIKNQERENITNREVRRDREISREVIQERNEEGRDSEQRNNNQTRDERRNVIIQEQKRSESRDNEINRERERIQINNDRSNQREQNRRNDSWINSNNDHRSSRNIEERRIEQNNNQRNDNREIRNQQRNENSRNERNREDVNQDRRQNTDQRQRSR